MELNDVDLNVLIYVCGTLVCDLDEGCLRDDLIVALKKLIDARIQKFMDKLEKNEGDVK